MPRKYEIPKVGDRFGKWTVVAEPSLAGHYHRSSIPCQCDCGTRREVFYQNLQLGLSTSCGCVRREILRKRNTVHGGADTNLYNRWCSIKDRCSNSNNYSSNIYVDRNIKVCPEWEKDFAAFRKWALANGFKESLDLDRIDNEKGYYPENCRWVTHKQNCRNTRRNRMLTAWGESKCVSAWAEDPRCKVPYDTLYMRINRLHEEPESAMTRTLYGKNFNKPSIGDGSQLTGSLPLAEPNIQEQ